jgi:hypothetical protein
MDPKGRSLGDEGRSRSIALVGIAILVLGACTGDSSIALSGCPPGGVSTATPFGAGPLGLGQMTQLGTGGSMAPGSGGSQGVGGSLVPIFPPGGCASISGNTTGAAGATGSVGPSGVAGTSPQ